jgi:hypothetical protein
MKKGMFAGGGVAALVVAAGFGGMAIAGGGGEREAGPRIVAEPMVATEKGPVTRAGKGAKITTFYVSEPVDPPENSGTVIGPQCPNKEGNAIGGGAAPSPGVVVSYLSQIRPSNQEIKGRVYWVGVDDNSETNPANAGAIVEVHCAKGIKVEKQ